jgi:hypothetical protein
MLKYVPDYLSQREKTGLKAVWTALDHGLEISDSSSEVFVKIDTWTGELDFFTCHFAVVKRAYTAPADPRIDQFGWIRLGKMADPTRAKFRRFRLCWKDPSLHWIYAFEHQKWLARAKLNGHDLAFDVSAPEQLWDIVNDFQEDITVGVEEDWATLTAMDGCVQFASLLVLPDSWRQGVVSVVRHPASTWPEIPGCDFFPDELSELYG